MLIRTVKDACKSIPEGQLVVRRRACRKRRRVRREKKKKKRKIPIQKQISKTTVSTDPELGPTESCFNLFNFSAARPTRI